MVAWKQMDIESRIESLRSIAENDYGLMFDSVIIEYNDKKAVIRIREKKLEA